MAHDFSIRALRENNSSNMAFFFGYCDGIMYEAFNMQHHDGFLSGDGSTEIISRRAAISGLDKAIAYFDKSHYPDPHRMDDIKEFRKKIDSEYTDANAFELFFG